MTKRTARLRNFVELLLAVFAVILLLSSGMAIARITARASADPPAAPQPRWHAPTAALARPAPPLGDPAAAIAALKNLEFRNIGPAVMGGRIDCFAVDDDNPDIIYVGTAAGGIFKSTNAGNTWTPIFDHEITSSIGALALAPSDHQVLWVGSGEANNRQSASWGAGVYRSIDGGRSFQHVGLEATQAIGRIAVDPRDPNTAYVAALGGLWNANHDRGVFKTTDGGRSWNQVLYVNDDTGAVDLAIDPQSPRTLFAAAYERRRTVFGFNGGGPDGGIYKTEDGGQNWRRITSGLPYADGSDVGRIGITVYPKNPAIIYARVQSLHGGIYRSEDHGETWVKMSDTNPRPSYFGVIAVDPDNDLRIWVPGAPLYYSQDGGKTFVTDRGNGVHSDYHGFWIDPHDSNHMVIGVDGGIYITRDAGRSWDHDNIIAIGQFYEVTANNQRPYLVCGGLQDNGSWCGPSFNLKGPIANSDWFTVGGGDGFYNRLDPVDPQIDYAESQDGNLLRRNLVTAESKSIRPREGENEANPYRFQWNSPIEISAADHKTIYYGGQYLFKSSDQGDSWSKISPDLTNNQDRRQMKILGRLPDRSELSREDGVEWWPCITVIGESPLNPQVIYVGTDDGNLQVTRDGGKNWTNVAGKVPGVPHGTYVSRVIGSKHAEGTAYATFDGHRSGDFHIYIYRTTDYGQSWHPISNGITEQDGTLHVIREDPKVPSLLYAGTERGLFVSFDTGQNWYRLRLNLPTMPVDDIFIHTRDNDMILGTHGRSIWILDDISPIQQLAQGVDADVKLLDIRPAYEFRTEGGRGGGGFGFGTHAFDGLNPPNGTIINFYFKNQPTARDRVSLAIADSSGKTLRTINCVGPRPAGQGEGQLEIPPELAQAGVTPAMVEQFFGGGGGCLLKQGVNRVVWDFRMDPPIPVQQALAGAGRGGGFFGGGGRGPLVDPGTFTVKLAMGDVSQTASAKVDEDPRVEISDADRAKRREAITKAYTLTHDMTEEQRKIAGLKTALDQFKAIWARPAGAGAAAAAAPGAEAAAAGGGAGGRGGRGGGGGRGAAAAAGAQAQAAPGANQAVAATIPENVRQAAEDLSKRVDEASMKFVNPPEPAGGEQGGAGPALVYYKPTLPARLGQVYGALQSVTVAPTPKELAELDSIGKELADITPTIDKLVSQDLPALNKMINDANVPRIVILPTTPAGGRRGMQDGQ